MSSGDQDVGNKHKIIWGVILTAVIGALPFTMVTGRMCLTRGKALYRDGRLQKLRKIAP